MPTKIRENREHVSNKRHAGQCVLMKAVTVTRSGAFMTMGEGSDVLVPISQQLHPIATGESHVVYLYLDPDNKLIGSTKLHRFLDERAKDMHAGQAVDLLIVARTRLGYKAVINNTHLGLLFEDEVYQKLQPGDAVKGYIKSIRDDRKIDLSLQGNVARARDELGERILAFLKSHGGASSLTDYSPPEAIYKQFGVSKASYKKALGQLYKQRLISITKSEIRLLTAEKSGQGQK